MSWWRWRRSEPRRRSWEDWPAPGSADAPGPARAPGSDPVAEGVDPGMTVVSPQGIRLVKQPDGSFTNADPINLP